MSELTQTREDESLQHEDTTVQTSASQRRWILLATCLALLAIMVPPPPAAGGAGGGLAATAVRFPPTAGGPSVPRGRWLWSERRTHRGAQLDARGVPRSRGNASLATPTNLEACDRLNTPFQPSFCYTHSPKRALFLYCMPIRCAVLVPSGGTRPGLGPVSLRAPGTRRSWLSCLVCISLLTSSNSASASSAFSSMLVGGRRSMTTK